MVGVAEWKERGGKGIREELAIICPPRHNLWIESCPELYSKVKSDKKRPPQKGGGGGGGSGMEGEGRERDKRGARH